jgi:hypothetical protein
LEFIVKTQKRQNSTTGMKKINYLLALSAVVLVFSGCGLKPDANKAGESNKVNEEASTGSKVISSIKEAMGLGQKMECIYTTNINGEIIQAITQVDGKNFKSSSEIDGRKMYSLMKDEVMYTWGEGIPTPSKLALSCMQELEKDIPKTEGAEPSTDNFKNPEESFDDATNVVCKPIASLDLSIPSDVQFQDMCEMMKGMMQGLKDMKVPSGVNIPTNIPGMPAANN